MLDRPPLEETQGERALGEADPYRCMEDCAQRARARSTRDTVKCSPHVSGWAAKLRVTAGPDAGSIVTVMPHGRLVVGRSDYPFSDDTLSREHFRLLHVDPWGILLFDLESSNGTYVNGERVTRARLFGGEVIHAGRNEFRVYLSSAS